MTNYSSKENKSSSTLYKNITYDDPLIWIKSNALTSEFCNSVIEKFEKDNRKYKGFVGNDKKVHDIKKSTDLNITNLEDWKEEDEIFYRSIFESYNEYVDHCNVYNNFFPDAYVGVDYNSNLNDSGYQIQRTNPGEYYGWHHDSSLENNYFRVATYLWYLNDVFNDGYTEFFNGTKVQPKQGNLLIFPSTWTYLHRGVSPKNEVKYICTGWMSYKLNQ